MAALSAPRNTPLRGGFPFKLSVPVAANVTIWKGSMVAVAVATGFATIPTVAVGYIAMGIADQTVVGTSVGGAVSVDVLISCAALVDTSTSFAVTKLGCACYFVDDHTVAAASATNSPAGIVIEIASSTQAWVYFDPPSPALTA